MCLCSRCCRGPSVPWMWTAPGIWRSVRWLHPLSTSSTARRWTSRRPSMRTEVFTWVRLCVCCWPGSSSTSSSSEASNPPAWSDAPPYTLFLLIAFSWIINRELHAITEYSFFHISTFCKNKSRYQKQTGPFSVAAPGLFNSLLWPTSVVFKCAIWIEQNRIQ